MIAVIGDTANAASIGLHAHHGFVETGSMPAVGFKFGRWVDSVRMQRTWAPDPAHHQTISPNARCVSDHTQEKRAVEGTTARSLGRKRLKSAPQCDAAMQ